MENILRHFFEFDKIDMAEPFGNGHINDTYKVSLLQKGAYRQLLLQRFNHHVFQQPNAVMENIDYVGQFLSESSYPLKILKPYKTNKGRLLYQDEKGNYWRVFDFFENTIAFDKVDTTDQAFQAAKAYGVFSKALNNIDATKLNITIPDFHNGAKRLADFEIAIVNAVDKRREETRSEIAEILEYKNIFKKIHQLKLPLRAVHHDTKINNVLFNENTNRIAAVIDLDTVMPGTVLSDFGDMVRTFTSSADEDENDFSKIKMRMDVYRSLEQGFLSEMGENLSEEEKRNLIFAGPWLTLMQVIRFLGDYLLGDVYYKIKNPTHNLIRAKNQLVLFRSMIKELNISGLIAA